MEFTDVAVKVLAAYGDGSYQDGIDLIRRARSDFPHRDSTLTFWEACLLSLAGKPGQAIDALEAGLERGLFWHRRMLADPDLDAARDVAAWEYLEERSTALTEAYPADPPETFIRHAPEPVGTVIALHGAGYVPEDFQSEWVTLIPDGWLVMAPVGDVPVSDAGWAWPYDLSTDSLVDVLRDIDLARPVVLLGFSQGGRLAAKVAWDGLVDSSGLILFAAGLSMDLWEESHQVPVPLYVVIGTEDLGYESNLAVVSALEKTSMPVHKDVRGGLGHRPPDDLEDTILAGLDWLLEHQPS